MMDYVLYGLLYGLLVFWNVTAIYSTYTTIRDDRRREKERKGQ